MPSLAEQALMLEALSGESDRDFPRGMAALREEAAADPDRWRWAISEHRRRQNDAGGTRDFRVY